MRCLSAAGIPSLQGWEEVKRQGVDIVQSQTRSNTPRDVARLLSQQAWVVKLVDTRDLKSLAARRTGSIPVPGTIVMPVINFPSETFNLW